MLERTLNQDPSSEPRYEAPRIESVMTADDLEREALYAGTPTR
jgi:hypothetical protein